MIDSSLLPEKSIVDRVAQIWFSNESNLMHNEDLKHTVTVDKLRTDITEKTVTDYAQVYNLLEFANFDFERLFFNFFHSSYSINPNHTSETDLETFEILATSQALLESITVSLICLDIKGTRDISENEYFLSRFKFGYC